MACQGRDFGWKRRGRKPLDPDHRPVAKMYIIDLHVSRRSVVLYTAFMHYTFRTKLWRYSGKAAWYFLSLPVRDAAAIQKKHAPIRRGWGSIPVIVTIGETSWKTSIFPDSKSNTYLLPVKAAVRKKEQLDEGQRVPYTLFI